MPDPERELLLAVDVVLKTIKAAEVEDRNVFKALAVGILVSGLDTISLKRSTSPPVKCGSRKNRTAIHHVYRGRLHPREGAQWPKHDDALEADLAGQV